MLGIVFLLEELDIELGTRSVVGCIWQGSRRMVIGMVRGFHARMGQPNSDRTGTTIDALSLSSLSLLGT